MFVLKILIGNLLVELKIFHVFTVVHYILIPYSILTRIAETNLDVFSARVLFKVSFFKALVFENRSLRHLVLHFLGFSSRVRNDGFGRDLTFPLALGVVNMKTFRLLGK